MKKIVSTMLILNLVLFMTMAPALAQIVKTNKIITNPEFIEVKIEPIRLKKVFNSNDDIKANLYTIKNNSSEEIILKEIYLDSYPTLPGGLGIIGATVLWPAVIVVSPFILAFQQKPIDKIGVLGMVALYPIATLGVGAIVSTMNGVF